MMQFESDFRFNMNENYGLPNQGLPCPSTSSSFSSASGAYDPFTPDSRRSTPNQLSLDFESHCASFTGSHPLDLTPPSTATPKYVLGQVQIKTEQEQVPFQEVHPMTPVKRVDSISSGYEQMMEMNMAQQHHAIGSITPSNSFGMYTVSPEIAMDATSFMMTPTQSVSGSEAAENNGVWPCVNESPISFFAQGNPGPQEMDLFDMDRQSTSPMSRYPMQGPASPNQMRAHRKMMVHEIQRKTSELQRAQVRSSRRSARPDAAPVDVVRRAMNKCDYPGCQKAFRRNEHLKRHKQTYHGEGPNQFTCEFCGKNQFNRKDNLFNHRKLHARPNSRNRGVEFIPAAVAKIEEEERSRKRRAPAKVKTEIKAERDANY